MEDLASEVGEYLPRRRPRRGLINAGGKLLSFLFGNPDANDFAAVQHSVEKTRMEQGKLIFVASQQSVVTRSLSRRVTDSAQRIQEVTNEVANLTQVVIRQQNRLGRLEEAVNATFAIAKRIRE
uniref:Uncharacterized protein n=1 Tax=Lygus hesperus TaxID=30085 RepID=A0A146KY18_LYGHE